MLSNRAWNHYFVGRVLYLI